MRRRAGLLIVTVGLALVAVACGRATQEQIEQALGITPTPTRSPAELATATARAAAQATIRAEAAATRAAAAAGTPGATAGAADLAALGDVEQGRRAFERNCVLCHRADGTGRGPSLAGANSPVVHLTDEQIQDLIRNGTNHQPPGPYQTFTISDQRILDIIAYLRSVSG